MCRSTDEHGFSYLTEKSRLRIQSFHLRLSFPESDNLRLPPALTLLYPPRINGNFLQINGSNVRPDSPAFVTLHRTLDGPVFASTDRIRASEGVRFEVYVKEEKALKGVFRKEEESEEWKMECLCTLESMMSGVSEAEVWVEGKGCGILRERVAMVARKKKRRGGFAGLEEIPEVRETEIEMDGCDCEMVMMDGEDEMEMGMEMMDGEDEVEMEGVRWAVDLGIWVMCLGVGILVSRASAKKLRKSRNRFLTF